MIRHLVLVASGVLLVAVTLLAGPVNAAVTPANTHYMPMAGDEFAYDETINVNNGLGDYAHYTESTAINGSIKMTAVQNGNVSAVYYNANAFQNSTGTQYRWTASGGFTYNPVTFLYVQGTDNQTGFTNPTVWFFMDNSLAAGGTFELLNTGMSVVSTSFNYGLNTPAGTNVKAIYADGGGTYERNDAYGTFTATYGWQAYFDPSTGYIIGYLYAEHDTNSSGDGFTYTDTLTVTQTSYTLTPYSSSSSGGQGTDYLLIGIIATVVIVVIIVIAVALSRRRRAPSLPRHSASGQVSYAPPPMGPAPPPVSLTPGGQPAVQQIVIKETVKVKCQYCGALIDSTAANCPFCGAPRT